jgi:hypothetical protein
MIWVTLALSSINTLILTMLRFFDTANVF